MVDATPKDFSRSPMEQFARFLMVSAKEDPALLRRAAASHSDNFLDRIRQLPAMLSPLAAPAAIASGDTPAMDPYLEELVSLAIASAREAEDASREAHAAIARSRRGTFAFASVAALGVMVGVAGMTSSHISSPALPDGEARAADATAVAPEVQMDPKQFAMAPFPAAHSPIENWGPDSVSLLGAASPGSIDAATPLTPVPDGSPANNSDDVAQARAPNGYAANVAAAPQRQGAGGNPPTAAVEVSSDSPPPADIQPASLRGDAAVPPARVAERRPAVRRTYRRVRYAYARPTDPFSRFVNEVQWRISSVFR
jgi:hypothetical protein